MRGTWLPLPTYRRLRGALALPGRACCLATALLAAASSVFAAAVHQIAQKNRDFSRNEMTIAAGDRIAFSNNDEFLHQIYVDSSEMSFDSSEQYPGQTITVTFPSAGTFPVRCHIHPKMLLTVHVR